MRKILFVAGAIVLILAAGALAQGNLNYKTGDLIGSQSFEVSYSVDAAAMAAYNPCSSARAVGCTESVRLCGAWSASQISCFPIETSGAPQQLTVVLRNVDPTGAGSEIAVAKLNFTIAPVRLSTAP